MQWEFVEEKNHFTEAVKQTLAGKIQRITCKNKTVIMSEEHYQQLTDKKTSLVEFFSSAPSFEGVDISRDKSLGREIDL